MRITLCGSIRFYKEMLGAKTELEAMGHEVVLPPSEIAGGDGKKIPVSEYYKLRKGGACDPWVWDRKHEVMKSYFREIEGSDAILVLNHEKDGIKGYIGANTLIEMGIAMHFNKRIFLLNPVPEMAYREEILGAKPVVIGGDLKRIV